MSKTLLLVEAPTKARHIQEILGKDYIVKASVGHVREMPMPKNMTVEEKKKYGDFSQDVNDDFLALYKVSADKKKIMAELRTALKNCDELILGSDPDDEGAAIAWHLLQELKPKVPTYRATWNEITEKAIREGLKNKKLVNEKKQEPRDFFLQAESALTRGKWDRLYGFSSSPYLWKALKPGTSSGRVQTPGARLIIEREERRLAFKVVSYYSITGDFEGTQAKLTEYSGQKIADGSKINDNGVLAKGYLLITDENLDSILKDLKTKQYEVGDVTSKPYRRSPAPPFTTSSALQSIGGKTRMSAKQLTSIFQYLYQNSYSTYIRTVSIEAAPEAIAEARKEIAATFGKHMVSATPRIYKDKKQGNSGHECLRPVLDDKSGKIVNPKLADAKQQQVFNLIRLRFLASQSIDCEGTTWTAKFNSTDGKAKFSASETEIHEPGWTAIYQVDEELEA